MIRQQVLAEEFEGAALHAEQDVRRDAHVVDVVGDIDAGCFGQLATAEHE